MKTGQRRSWVPVAVMAALVAAVVQAAWPTGVGVPDALVGAGPRDAAMLACGYCGGAALFMAITDTWVAFLSSPSSWGKLAGCATACITMVT